MMRPRAIQRRQGISQQRGGSMRKQALALVLSAAVGSGATIAAVTLVGGPKTVVVAQSEHTFLTGNTENGHPQFENQSCGRVLGEDGGILSEPCVEGILSAEETACAQVYFECVVTPRVRAKAK